MDKKILFEKIEALYPWLVEVRRDFHRHPELGMEEYRTRDQIVKYLKEMGVETKADIAKTGVVGLIRGGSPGRTIALRADMDALPMQDEKNAPYKSTVDGKMHSCGHDAHMTILLGTAKILSGIRNQLKGNVKLLFQPAEETVGGAKPMIEEGVLENPPVDGVLGLHVSTEDPTGTIGVRYGQMNAASDGIKIILHGESTHGAYPHSGVDAIAMAGQVITALQTVVSRNVDPRDSAVVTLGTIQGGTKQNIISNRVEMTGTVRTLDPKTRSKVIDRVEKIVLQIAAAMGGKGEVLREEGYTALINDDEMVHLVRDTGKELLGEDNVLEVKHATLGVEDFAYFAAAVPGAFFKLGCRNEEKGSIYDGHTTLFDIDEEALKVGVAMQVSNVLRFLKQGLANK
ncbi:amidohydrolase [Geosporobacter subterraneus DSM 17957]|uniref:Amidohydrolase n=1 Tax=Geosporobacter subterraneus DSM 17957 TaxID=1121919 RepID=A0A1M6L9H8_9FIRM|nr:amidohydrolase [Geosporobacter subterraneus]SHJ67860.1 amidohydrolase [Geosporobacter subterraneus DSM 17957]